ncbi:MAG: thioredoxin fold domain-containing protein [Pseudomonadota bacterium]
MFLSSILLSFNIRKFYLLTSLFSCLLLTQITIASTIQIKQIENIKIASQLAKEKKLPLLILFSMTHCPFCVLIKENFLIPMMISGDYNDKVIIREINIEENLEIIGLSGKQQASYRFANNMGVSLYPTMIFVDYQGCKLVDSIEGINTPSLFGGRIDDAIDTANQKIQQGLINCN